MNNSLINEGLINSASEPSDFLALGWSPVLFGVPLAERDEVESQGIDSVAWGQPIAKVTFPTVQSVRRPRFGDSYAVVSQPPVSIIFTASSLRAVSFGGPALNIVKQEVNVTPLPKPSFGSPNATSRFLVEAFISASFGEPTSVEAYATDALRPAKFGDVSVRAVHVSTNLPEVRFGLPTAQVATYTAEASSLQRVVFGAPEMKAMRVLARPLAPVHFGAPELAGGAEC